MNTNNGWKLVRVNEAFSDLMFWLERCSERGHLDNCYDLVAPWEAFKYEYADDDPIDTEPDAPKAATCTEERPCLPCYLDQGACAADPAAPGSPASTQPIERDWEISCDHCNGSGHVFVKHQVAERKTDVQEFKEDCECCDGRGFTIAFEDIPGIAEYVKSCRPASTVADEGAKDERALVMEAITEVWDHATRIDDATDEVIDILRPAPAAGDALDEPTPEWAACESRRPWVTNSLKANAHELREKEKRCRSAFNKDFMGVPSRYVADAYAEAAAVFEAKLAALAASQQGGE